MPKSFIAIACGLAIATVVQAAPCPTSLPT